MKKQLLGALKKYSKCYKSYTILNRILFIFVKFYFPIFYFFA